MGKTCAICGESSGMYPLCRKHLQMKTEGEVVKCAKCGTWHITNKPCPNCAPIQNTTATKSTSESELTCIICGEPSNGKHFCRSCYAKYKDRSVDIRITHCMETEILDEYGNRKYTCDDGRKVRSKSEKIISDFLFKEKVRAVYEKTIYYYPKQGETIELHPDFYLPDYDYYIEHNGLNSKSYKANKAKTEQMYHELNYKLIITTEDDLENISAKLKPILKIN